MTAATVHERVCALMRDGESRTVAEVMSAVGSNANGVRPVLQALEIEGSLRCVRDPRTQLRVYVWNEA